MPQKWVGHSRMSDPGEFLSLLGQLPTDPRALSQILQGVLVHSDWLVEYGLKADKAPSRETLPVAERLRQVFALDASPIEVQRPPERRLPATCRDFALLLCSFMRSKGIPARLRCGFASYLGGNLWEDHWVCEYWDRGSERWKLADAQMDTVLTAWCKVTFDPAQLPREAFLTAGKAWAKSRAGSLDPKLCGHGAATGLWFIAVNVARDHYVLNNRETSPWDGWRAAHDPETALMQTALSGFDDLAEHPEQPLKPVEFFWMQNST